MKHLGEPSLLGSTEILQMKTVDEIAREQLSIETIERFLKSGSLFNCEEKGKTLLSVIF